MIKDWIKQKSKCPALDCNSKSLQHTLVCWYAKGIYFIRCEKCGVVWWDNLKLLQEK
jgi:uncharacterized Zn finger protein